MKRTLLTLALASGLLAGMAQAEEVEQVFTYDNEEYCQTLATSTSYYAKARIQGDTLEEIHQGIHEADFKDDIAWDARFIAEYVFKYPHQSPSEEGNDIYALCRDGT